jgi:hypothetical protein
MNRLPSFSSPGAVTKNWWTIAKFEQDAIPILDHKSKLVPARESLKIFNFRTAVHGKRERERDRKYLNFACQHCLFNVTAHLTFTSSHTVPATLSRTNYYPTADSSDKSVETHQTARKALGTPDKSIQFHLQPSLHCVPPTELPNTPDEWFKHLIRTECTEFI